MLEHRHLHSVCDMAKLVRHLHPLDVVHLHLVRRRDVHLVDAQQNLGEQIRDVHQTLVDVHQDVMDVVLVDVELRHLQKMDYYQRAEDVAYL